MDREFWRAAPIEKLRAMLEAERKRGLAGHWTYDLARHRAMLEVFKTRREAL